jgi:hypothetical protein
MLITPDGMEEQLPNQMAAIDQKGLRDFKAGAHQNRVRFKSSVRHPRQQ